MGASLSGDRAEPALSLDVELAGLRDEVHRLRVENDRLLRILALSAHDETVPGPAQTGIFDGPVMAVTAGSAPEAKVAFFAALFRARRDVYAVRWENRTTGRAGWMPAVRGGWRKGQRLEERAFLPLTNEVITAHLSGETDLGVYPMLAGDTCWWLAADFDGPAAMLDALAYLKACRGVGVPGALEISRSGRGAHVWIFFTAAVPAALARQLGTGLVREAIALRGSMDLRSYDRLFPSQDLLQSGGFGNLIAAPLQGRCRRRGATAFLDLGTLEPYRDQWAYLSTVGRVTPAEVAAAARRVGQVRVGTDVTTLRAPTSTQLRVPAAAKVRARLGAAVTLTGADLSPELLATLTHAASMANPVFYERQRRRASTWDIPRFLRNYDQTLEGDLVLPRGLLDRATTLVEQAGSTLAITDEREKGTTQTFTFGADLEPEQQAAHDALAGHDLGVLVAPPGAGKTVIASALVATHGVSTLILVDRKVLAEQWRTRLTEVLGVKPGQRGGGRSRTTGILDIATLQTLARNPAREDIMSGYGLVVVDECHHLPAAAFDHAVRQITARRWLGLTATPYRRDGLEELITLQLGPVRHTIGRPAAGTLTVRDGGANAPEPRLHLHPTDYRYDGPADPQQPGGMAAIYRDMVENTSRNHQILEDVSAALRRGRRCLILTNWTSHLERLEAHLAERGISAVTMRGGMSVKARTAALARLSSTPEGRPLLVLATGSYVGEGFDVPSLDTLFLSVPLASKGRLVQYAGRILRAHPGKVTAEVHDYHDEHTGVLASSLAKRAPGFTSLGFPDPRHQ